MNLGGVENSEAPVDQRNDDMDQNKEARPLNTSSTADGGGKFDISFESRNKLGVIGANDEIVNQEAQEPAVPRLTLE